MSFYDAFLAATLPIGYFAIDLIRAWFGISR